MTRFHRSTTVNADFYTHGEAGYAVHFVISIDLLSTQSAKRCAVERPRLRHLVRPLPWPGSLLRCL